jgi:hypothetical protein
MLLTFTKSKFDVAEGQYLARFLGVDLLEPKPGEAPRLGQDGKPMAPGMAWRFEIAEGESLGKIADRVTGRVPGPKNVCGRFLAAVSGQILKDGMTVDLGQFVGKLYRINVVAKDNGNGTCVSDMGLTRDYGAAPAANGATKPPPPPGAVPAGPPTEPADESRWQVWDAHSNSYVLMTGRDVRAYLAAQKMVPSSLSCAPDGTQDVRTADAHGFTGLPF